MDTRDADDVVRWLLAGSSGMVSYRTREEYFVPISLVSVVEV